MDIPARALQRLPNPLQRSLALRNLVAQLNPDEHRQLQELLNRPQIWRDVIGAIPLELVATVASYLEPLDLVRFRSVCKQWNEVFRSDHTCRAALSALFSGEEDSIPGLGASPEAVLYSKVKRWYAYWTGRPYGKSHEFVVNLAGRPPEWLQTVAYYEGTLAWIGSRGGWGTPTKVCLDSLKPGMVIRESFDIQQECPRSVTLSARLLGIMTHRRACIAIDLASREERSFQVPRYSSVTGFTSYEGMLALLLLRGLDSPYVVVHWDYDTEVASIIDLLTAVPLELQQPDQLLIHPTGDSVVIFAHGGGLATQYAFARLALDGTVMCFHLQLGLSMSGDVMLDNMIHRSDFSGRFTIFTLGRRRRPTESPLYAGPMGFLICQYDSIADCLVYLDRSDVRSEWEPSNPVAIQVLCWKDVLYVRELKKEETPTRVVSMKGGELVTGFFRASTPGFARPSRSEGVSRMFGDENCHVMISRKAAHVWSFNYHPNGPLPPSTTIERRSLRELSSNLRQR